MSKNGQVRKTREGAPLPSEGAGAEMNELGLPRTCRPGRGTDPTKNRDPERHTTQHAGKVEAKDTGGGERAHGDVKRRASRPTGGGARRATNHQEVEGNETEKRNAAHGKEETGATPGNDGGTGRPTRPDGGACDSKTSRQADGRTRAGSARRGDVGGTGETRRSLSLKDKVPLGRTFRAKCGNGLIPPATKALPGLAQDVAKRGGNRTT